MSFELEAETKITFGTNFGQENLKKWKNWGGKN